jgi:RNA polymerase sigma-70 factor (ECF subfamily)
MRMSKPLAAKGVGACLKHVLNTRLSAGFRLARKRAEHGGPVDIMATREKGGGPSPGKRVQLSTGTTLPVPRLESDDPLPPDDRAVFPAPASLGELYRMHAPRLLRFFARRGQQDEAGDLVQESFTRFADARARMAGAIDRPEAYLSRIATNLVRNRAKTALRRSLASHIPADDVPLTTPDPVAALEARDQIDRLQKALASLAPKTRDIFLAHRLDGDSYKDIARQTGLSVKGVEWHMGKAIAHLDRVLRHR